MKKRNIPRTAPEESRGRLATIGVIGLGARTETLLASLLALDGVDVAAVCDVSDKAIAKILAIFKRQKRRLPQVFKDYHSLLSLPEVDAVLVPTSWNSHLPIAIDALEAGKYAAIEVGGASSPRRALASRPCLRTDADVLHDAGELLLRPERTDGAQHVAFACLSGVEDAIARPVYPVDHDCWFTATCGACRGVCVRCVGVASQIDGKCHKTPSGHAGAAPLEFKAIGAETRRRDFNEKAE